MDVTDSNGNTYKQPTEGPDHYVHGSVNAQIIYWKRRAESAEARCLRLEEDLATLRRSQAKP